LLENARICAFCTLAQQLDVGMLLHNSVNRISAQQGYLQTFAIYDSESSYEGLG